MSFLGPRGGMHPASPLDRMDPASPLSALVTCSPVASPAPWNRLQHHRMGLLGSLKNKEENDLRCRRKAVAFLLGLRPRREFAVGQGGRCLARVAAVQ